jgi:hypothetical protein
MRAALLYGVNEKVEVRDEPAAEDGRCATWPIGHRLVVQDPSRSQ